MAATMAIIEANGASYTPGSGGTNKAAGTIAFRANDSSSTDTANPVVKPAASTQQSYEKWLKLRASGSFTSISSPRFYCSGVTPATGVTLYARTTNPSGFSAPAVPANNTGGTDATGYNSGSTKSLAVAAAGPWSSAGDVGDFLVLWASLSTSVGPGALFSGGSFVFAWDEI